MLPYRLVWPHAQTPKTHSRWHPAFGLRSALSHFDFLRILTRCLVLSALMLSIASCGGGGGGGGSDSNGGSSAANFEPILSFKSPDTFLNGRVGQTSAGITNIRGGLHAVWALSAIPSCGSNGGFSSGVVATIHWKNDANDAHGQTPLVAFCTSGYLYGVQVGGIDFGFLVQSVPLEEGFNIIVLTTYENDKPIGRDTIVIRRLDGVAPEVLSVYPQNDAAEVTINSKISVQFSEAMDQSTLTDGRFYVSDPDGTGVAGSRHYESQFHTWTFTPSSPLGSNKTYTVSVGRDVLDASGESLRDRVTWSFSTGTSLDEDPPSLTSVWPEGNCQCAPRNVHILAGFDKRIDPNVITADSIQLQTSSGALIPGAVIYHQTFIEFLPDNLLVRGESYQANLSARLEDHLGNFSSDGHSWSFTVNNQDPVGAWSELAILPRSLTGASVAWNGSDFYIWGTAESNGEKVSTGYRYDSVQDEWKVIANQIYDFGALVNFPEARAYPTLISIGEDLLLFNGLDDNDGAIFGAGRYSPSTDTWQEIAFRWSEPNSDWQIGVPGLYGHSTVWTGDRLIVWGGLYLWYGVPINRGWSYDPVYNKWKTMGSLPTLDSNFSLQPDTTNPLAARRNHVAIWTGSEMLIWGGNDNNGTWFNDGALYSPDDESWRSLTSVNAPNGSNKTVTGIWTGTAMLAWNGSFRGNSNTPIGSDTTTMRQTQLSRWDSVTNTWVASTSGWEPRFDDNRVRTGYFAFWDGARMLVVGSESTAFKYDDQSRRYETHTLGVYIYDPVSDCWKEGVKYTATLNGDFQAEMSGPGRLLISDGIRNYLYTY